MDQFIPSQSAQPYSYVLNELSRMNLQTNSDSYDSSNKSPVAYTQENMPSIYPVSPCSVPVMRLTYEERKFLSTARVVQGNIVCVFNLPPHLEEGPHLKDFSHFGHYGQVVKVTLRRKIAKNKAITVPLMTPKGAVSAFIVYRRCEDALRAIISLSKMKISGRQLKATLGSAVYCKNALRGLVCNEPNCVKLHFKCAAEATFNAEQMAGGLHIAYQRKKLIEIYQKHFTNWTGDSGALWIPQADLEDYLADLASMEFGQEPCLYQNGGAGGEAEFLEDQAMLRSLNSSKACSGQNSTFYSPRGSVSFEGPEGLESRRPSTLSSTTFLRQMMLSSPDQLKVETLEPPSSLSEGSSPLSELMPKQGAGPLQLSPRQQQLLQMLRRSAGYGEPAEPLKPIAEWDSHPFYHLAGRSSSWPMEKADKPQQPLWPVCAAATADSGFGSTLSCDNKKPDELRSCLTSLFGDSRSPPLLSPVVDSTEEDSQQSEEENECLVAKQQAATSSDESGLGCVSPPSSALVSSSALDFDPVEAAKYGLAREMLCESALRLAEMAVQSLHYLSPAALPASSQDTLKSLIGSMNLLVRASAQAAPEQPLEEASNEAKYQSLASLHQNLTSTKQQYISQLQNVLGLLSEENKSLV